MSKGKFTVEVERMHPIGLLSLLALLLGAPAAQAAPGAFEKLGTFIGKGGAMSRRVGPGPGGTERFYVCYTYLSSLDLVGYEREAGKYQVWRHPEGGTGARAIAKKAVLFLWDPKARQVVWQGVPSPGAGSIGNLVLGGDGLIYGPAGKELFAFDPGRRAVVARTSPPQGSVVRAGLHALKDGRIVALRKSLGP